MTEIKTTRDIINDEEIVVDQFPIIYEGWSCLKQNNSHHGKVYVCNSIGEIIRGN